MKHAGVAITITSVTDLLAFGIGATSVLPALGSFCTYASIGIFSIYLNMASFFLALLVIDQRRIDDRRDAIFCCWKKDENWTANKCSQKSYMDICFRLYSNIIELTHQRPKTKLCKPIENTHHIYSKLSANPIMHIHCNSKLGGQICNHQSGVYKSQEK